jgi:hypothetical protein
MHTDIHSLFEHLWQDYLAITPSAQKIHQLLGGDNAEQSSIVNDHIALRTFNFDKVSLSKLAAHFLALGYQEQGQYQFAAKKLNAKHFAHPDPNQPKVFISELLVEQFDQPIQQIIHGLVAQMEDSATQDENFLYSGTHWTIEQADYQKLLAVSEYAAWMSLWGFRANHFTVSVNHLTEYQELSEVNHALKTAGFELNRSGGEIKGGAEVGLAQSSTMADKQPVQLKDKTIVAPSCFYEFAQRYPMQSGELYQGFVTASADKIFESTHAN